MTGTRNFERFHYSNFEISFVPFLVERTTMENATFPYKTALSKDNLKANRMGSTK